MRSQEGLCLNATPDRALQKSGVELAPGEGERLRVKGFPSFLDTLFSKEGRTLSGRHQHAVLQAPCSHGPLTTKGILRVGLRPWSQGFDFSVGVVGVKVYSWLPVVAFHPRFLRHAVCDSHDMYSCSKSFCRLDRLTFSSVINVVGSITSSLPCLTLTRQPCLKPPWHVFFYVLVFQNYTIILCTESKGTQ